MKLLVLSHNTPFPPNKGDKIRAFHMLRGLAQTHEVHLLSLSKVAEDVQYRDELLQFCKTVEIFPLNRWLKKVFALLCIISPFPLTFGFFFSLGFRKALEHKLAEEPQFDLALALCSSTAQYLQRVSSIPVVVDFVDIDSEKWGEYAQMKSFPASWIYALEFKRLRRWEGKIHRHAARSLLTTQREQARLAAIADTSVDEIAVIPNGIDLTYYRREQNISIEPIIVFTGQMDYLPNIDAVVYFYINVWPLVQAALPRARFEIVGRNPPEELREICKSAVVTGEVDDVRMYLSRARAFVAPLRLSFGSQYKVLEAMASGIPVVATSHVVHGLQAVPDRDLLVADSPEEFAAHVVALLQDEQLAQRIAGNAQKYIRENHDWNAIAQTLNGLLEEVVSGGRQPYSATR